LIEYFKEILDWKLDEYTKVLALKDTTWLGFISLKTIEINKYNMFNVYIVFTSMT